MKLLKRKEQHIMGLVWLLNRLVKAVLNDENAILTVSTFKMENITKKDCI